MTPMDVFITEGNVDKYLAKLHETWNHRERGTLLSLVREEEGRMGHRREHLERANGRATEGRERLEKQRDLLANASLPEEHRERARFLLETMEMTQLLLEGHLRWMCERFDQSRL